MTYQEATNPETRAPMAAMLAEITAHGFECWEEGEQIFIIEPVQGDSVQLASIEPTPANVLAFLGLVQ